MRQAAQLPRGRLACARFQRAEEALTKRFAQLPDHELADARVIHRFGMYDGQIERQRAAIIVRAAGDDDAFRCLGPVQPGAQFCRLRRARCAHLVQAVQIKVRSSVL